ncbi:hypothetical protein DFH11DRAFT_1637759 [Phellopilus nigrolimitatus]|nr:hypothetical protein DFH11DRAFT_1637759 [Phellopilus nigrolimitatus]
MASQQQLRPWSINVVFGFRSLQCVEHLGMLLASDTKSVLFPCVAGICDSSKIIEVSLQSAEFDSAVQLNEDPLDKESLGRCIKGLAGLNFSSVRQEATWLEHILRKCRSDFAGYGDLIYDYGKAEKTGFVMDLETLLNTHGLFLSSGFRNEGF